MKKQPKFLPAPDCNGDPLCPCQLRYMWCLISRQVYWHKGKPVIEVEHGKFEYPNQCFGVSFDEFHESVRESVMTDKHHALIPVILGSLN